MMIWAYFVVAAWLVRQDKCSDYLAQILGACMPVRTANMETGGLQATAALWM